MGDDHQASQRGGGQQLATHLLNEYDNDRVEIAEVRGALARDLHGTMAEWRAIASAAKSKKYKKYLYSLSANPDPDQKPLTRQQYTEFFDRVEQKLGLSGQPRVIVFHKKYGREHAHAVWSRTNGETLKAINIYRDGLDLRDIVIDFARDHGMELPPGYFDAKKKKRAEKLPDKQQQERTGVTLRDHEAAITAAWKESDNGPSFVRALEARGYYLARGTKRKTPSYVVIDRFGEVHSLARRIIIDGINTKQVKARLKDFPLEQLPPPERAKDYAEQRLQSLPAPELQRQFGRAVDPRAAMDALHRHRRAELDNARQRLEAQHRQEREALSEAQAGETHGVVSNRLLSKPRGMLAFLQRITGIRAIIGIKQKRDDRLREEDQQRQREALARRHDREMQDFDRHYRSIGLIEQYEKRSLETRLKRDQMRAVLAPFLDTGREMTDTGKSGDKQRLAFIDQFREASIAVPEQGTVAPSFNKLSDALKARGEQRRKEREAPERDPGRERDPKNGL